MGRQQVDYQQIIRAPRLEKECKEVPKRCFSESKTKTRPLYNNKGRDRMKYRKTIMYECWVMWPIYVGQYDLLWREICSINHLHHVVLRTISWSRNPKTKFHSFILLPHNSFHTPKNLHFLILSVIMENNNTGIATSPVGWKSNHSHSHHHLESQSHKIHRHNDMLPSTSILLIIIPIIIIILLIAISLLIVMLKRIQSAKDNGISSKSRSVINNSNCMFIAHSTINIHSSPGN